MTPELVSLNRAPRFKNADGRVIIPRAKREVIQVSLR
jgi:hypothetical protein